MTLSLKFWGVRGSIACPQPQFMKYGGNTSCLELTAGENRIVLDAGTGIRLLGGSFYEQDTRDAFVLLTHTHWDHINGFPFFRPAYDPSRALKIMAGHLKHQGGVQSVLSTQMNNPMFPVPLEAMQAKLDFIDFIAGDDLDLHSDLKVRTTPLNHPNGATAYRFEMNGESLCYVTDTEHFPDKLDENILNLIEGSDVMIYDSTYTEEEYPKHIGWGHSTWNEGVKLCREAGVRRLGIFHHDPEHDDDFMDAVEAEAKAEFEGAFVCREGMVIVAGED